MLEYAASPNETSNVPPEAARDAEVPDQPAEVVRELLRETRYLSRVMEKTRLEQKEHAASQLKILERIQTATNVWLLLVLLGLIVSCLVGSGIL
jgi:hypothetical protein